MSRLMTDAHKFKMNKNRVKFLQNLKINELLLDILMEDYSLTQEHRDDIMSEKTQQSKVATLLDIIPRRPDKAFDRFVYALVETGNDHLAQILDPLATQKYVKSRATVGHHSDVTSSGTILAPPAGYQQLPMVPAYMQAIPAHQRTWVYGIPQIAPSFANNENLSHPIQESSHRSTVEPDEMIADFKKVVERGDAIMSFSVIPTPHAQAIHIMNTELVYKMSGKVRGRVVVVSNQVFLTPNHRARLGTQFDEQNICNLFTKLQFETVLYPNKTRDELLSLLKQEQNLKSHEFYDAFVLVLLTHGNTGHIFASDGNKIPIDEIVNMFDGQNCPMLQGKPKLFLIQACQGNRKSSAYQHDGPSSSVDAVSASTQCSEKKEEDPTVTNKFAEMMIEDRPGYIPEVLRTLPSESRHEKADILIAYATVKGYEAWRHSELGSWFIRSLVYVFSREAHSSHVVDMLTKANYLMSHLQTEGTPLPYRQVAEKRDTFVKKLYFLPSYVGT